MTAPEQVAWLLEWPATKFLPARYYAADEHQPVLDPNSATRFCRREDALAVGKAVGLAPVGRHRIPSTTECTAVEHAWLPSDALENARAEKTA
jgi:hypothetical protein